jgi:membrane-associated protease RseP (regulator of RpoE activity)
MLMVDLYTVSVLIFFSILAVLIYRDRKKIDVKYVLFMRRTKRFSGIIDRIANISPRFWKALGAIGIIVCLFMMANGVYSMFYTAYLVYTGVITRPAVQIALPSLESQVSVSPFIIGIPFWFWIIVIAVIMIPHEIFHGIMSRADKIRLKDVGVMLLAIFPGAFVEPDEKQLEKSKIITKLRIFSAGTFANLIIGFSIIILVQSLLWAPNIDGIAITRVNNNTPAYSLGLKEGMVLQSINGKPMTMSFSDYSYLILLITGSNTENVTSYLSNRILAVTMSSYNPGDNITMKVDGKDYNLTLGTHPDIENFPYIGIGSRLNVANAGMFVVLFPLLGLMSSLSILVGIFNILPIYPLDGGLVVKAIADRFFKAKRANQITMAITFMMVLVILYSVIMPIIYSL